MAMKLPPELLRWEELSPSARTAVRDVVELFADRVCCRVELDITSDGGQRDLFIRVRPEGWRRLRDSRVRGT